MLNIGIIGTASHTKDNLLPALQETEGIELYAIQSRDRIRAQEFAQRFRIQSVSITSDETTLLRDSKCDGVVVAATPRVHEDLLREATRLNRNVFVEKPPATDLASFQSIEQALTVASPMPVIQFGFNFRFSDFYRSLEDHIKNRHTSITYMKIKSYASKPLMPMWQYNDVLSSSLYAVHIHAIEMLCYTLGEVVNANSQLVKIGQDRYVIVVMINFANSKIGLLEMSNASNRFEFDVECIDTIGNVFRSEGFNRLSISGPSFEGLPLGAKSSVVYEIPFLKGGFTRTGYTRQFEFFRDSIISGTPDLKAIESCLGAYKVIETIVQSEK